MKYEQVGNVTTTVILLALISVCANVRSEVVKERQGQGKREREKKRHKGAAHRTQRSIDNFIKM